MKWQICLATAAIAFSTPCLADYYITMTEISDTQLSVSMNFPGYPVFNGIVNAGSAQPEAWALLSGGQVLVSGGDPVTGSYLGMVAWLEPNSQPANPTYNVFAFGYDPSGGTAESISVFSDMTASAIQGWPGINQFFAGCGLGGGSPCPILQNGQTENIQVFKSYSDTIYGNMAVTFTDNADAVTAAPEPATWLMMILGFCSLGFLAYRGRFRALHAA